MPTPMGSGVSSGAAAERLALGSVVSGTETGVGAAAACGVQPASWLVAVRAGARRRFWQERDMVALHKRTRWEETVGASRERPPWQLLASGKFVISGRAASCNQPSTRNGGINLHSEVAPQSISKISSRLAQQPPWPAYGLTKERTEHTNPSCLCLARQGAWVRCGAMK